MVEPNEEKKDFKYWRTCKLPTCREPFGTNREWKDFHTEDCRIEWHKLLGLSHEKLIVEIMTLKERVNRLELELRNEIQEIKKHLGFSDE